MAYTNQYILDIPLKRPQETFVDDPELYDEVLSKELEFDLEHGVKDINRLHVFHAIAVLHGVLVDLIALQKDETAFREFRAAQLAKYGLNMEALEHEEGPSGFHDDDLPKPVSLCGDENKTDLSGLQGNFDDLKAPGSSRNDDEQNPEISVSHDRSFESVNDALNGADLDSSSDLGTQPRKPRFSSLEAALAGVSGVSDDLTENPNLDDPHSALASPSTEIKEPEFISTELLVQTTSLEKVPNPITAHSSSRLRKEVIFHNAPKTKAQAEHLVRCFGLAKPPPISIEEFLLRINKYSPSVSVSVYIHSAYLLFKLAVLLDVVTFTELNVYRFILALIRSLTKKCEDVYQKQKSFAMVGGMALKDLGKIEVSFLYLCNFKLVVSEFILNDFLKNNFVDLRRFCRERFSEKEDQNMDEAEGEA